MNNLGSLLDDTQSRASYIVEIFFSIFKAPLTKYTDTDIRQYNSVQERASSMRYVIIINQANVSRILNHSCEEESRNFKSNEPDPP